MLYNCQFALLLRGSDPNGIRTRVTAVKGRCPGPLDDRVAKAGQYRIEFAARKANWEPERRSQFFEIAGDAAASTEPLSAKIDNQLCRPSGSAAMLRQNFPSVLHK